MLSHMRTTVTLDDDALAVVRRRMRERGVSFKQALNDAIRDGAQGRPSAEFATRTADLGDWILVSLVGIVTIVPLVLFTRAAQSIPMTVIGPMQYCVPVINFLLGWLAFDEDLPPSRIDAIRYALQAQINLAVPHR